MPSDSYYRYYDLLHSNKDYDAEVEVVLHLYRQSHAWEHPLVLDVGCGTGNHSFAFARQGCTVIAIDTDSQMLNIAKQKPQVQNTPVRFSAEDISDLGNHDFDLAVAMFNVVNYIDDPAELILFFTAIHQRLRPDGILVFDCFNGIAALLDPPAVKTTEIEGTRNEKIKVTLRPSMHTMQQTFRIDARVAGNDGTQPIEFDYAFEHRLWTPREIEEAIVRGGFPKHALSRWMSPDEAATSADWKVMFTCWK